MKLRSAKWSALFLSKTAFSPVEAEDYDSAVNQLNEPWPDLILLDWMLPGGSGLQFIKLLKREAMTAIFRSSCSPLAVKKRIAYVVWKPVPMIHH
ncbi:transcriptional regulator PhoB [Raoultella ornithinolytica]|nr:transcriptional regulator PhoB [Raoultella ornithinolytica]